VTVDDEKTCKVTFRRTRWPPDTTVRSPKSLTVRFSMTVSSLTVQSPDAGGSVWASADWAMRRVPATMTSSTMRRTERDSRESYLRRCAIIHETDGN
jgi:hypothetical protein